MMTNTLSLELNRFFLKVYGSYLAEPHRGVGFVL